MSTYTIYFDYSEAAAAIGDEALERLPEVIKQLEDTVKTAGCTFTSTPTTAGLACKFAYPEAGIQEIVEAHMARQKTGLRSLPMKLIGKVVPAVSDRAENSAREILTANVHSEVDSLIEGLLVGFKELAGVTVFKDFTGIYTLPSHTPAIA
jgi:hypothetical protein